VKRTPEEEAVVAAESLWEPDWKKILVDSNAVLLMSGRSSLLGKRSKFWREITYLFGQFWRENTFFMTLLHCLETF
jgi:hypothetical protein